MGNYGFDLISWWTVKNWLETREKVLATKRAYEFDERTQYLRMYPEPNSSTRFWGVIACYVERPIRDIIKENDNEDKIKKLEDENNIIKNMFETKIKEMENEYNKIEEENNILKDKNNIYLEKINDSINKIENFENELSKIKKPINNIIYNKKNTPRYITPRKIII